MFRILVTIVDGEALGNHVHARRKEIRLVLMSPLQRIYYPASRQLQRLARSAEECLRCSAVASVSHSSKMAT
jgi:hypothetical protein